MGELNDVMEAFDRLLETLADEVKRLVEKLNELFKCCETSVDYKLVWKPYRCRVCGHLYMTRNEVRWCIEGHSVHTSKGCRIRNVPMNYSGRRIVPRNREAIMRSTEIRRIGSVGSKRRG